jgi:hypothetical protein
VPERGHVREVVGTNKNNQAALKNIVVEAKLQSLKVVYSTLKDQVQGLAPGAELQ